MKKLISLTLFAAAASLLWVCKAPTPTLTICKKTIPAGGLGFPIHWGVGSAGSQPPPYWVTLSDAQCSSVNVGPGQDHFNTFEEKVPAGWTLTNITCNYTTSVVKFIGANANPAFQPGDHTVTIDLNESNVTCTFVNQQQPQPPCCDNYVFDLTTGQGGAATDPLWSVNTGSAFITAPSSAWMIMPPAEWIQPVASPPAGPVPPGTFQYRIRFDVPACATGHVELMGTFAADNSATASLDMIPIPNASCPGPNCFNAPQAPVPLYLQSIQPGIHTLQIDVTNEGGPSGLVMNGRLRRVCP